MVFDVEGKHILQGGFVLMNVDTQQSGNFAIKNLDNMSILHFGYDNMVGVKVKKVDNITSGTAEIGLTDMGLNSNLEYASTSVNPRDIVVALAIEDGDKRDVYDDLQDILYKGAEIALFVGDDFLDGRRGRCGVIKGIMSEVSANRFKKGLQEIQYTIHCVEPYWYDIEDYDTFTEISESWFTRVERLSTISFEKTFSEATTLVLGAFKGNVEDNAQIEVSIDVDSDISGTLQIGNPSVDDELIELDCPVNDGRWRAHSTVTVDTVVGRKTASMDCSYYADYFDTVPVNVLCYIRAPLSWDTRYFMIYGCKNGRITMGVRGTDSYQVLNDSSYGDILCFYVDDDHPNVVRFLTSNKIYAELKWDGSKPYLDENTQEQLTDSSSNTEVIHTATMNRQVIDGQIRWIITVGGVVYRLGADDKFEWASKVGVKPPFDWTKSEFKASQTIYCLSYGLGKYMGAGNDDTFVYSQDGINWTELDTSTSSGISGVLYNAIVYGDKFVAAGSADMIIGRQPRVLYSSDGIEWSTKNLTDVTSNATDLYAIAYGNGLYVTAGTAGAMAYSTDGIEWTRVSDSGFSKTIRGIAYGDGYFVAVSDEGYVGYSSDGISWSTSAVSFPTDTNIRAIAYGNGTFVAIAYGGYALHTTSDKLSSFDWTVESGVGLNNPFDICYGNGFFVAVGDKNKTIYSSDGTAWVVAEAGFAATIKPFGITYGDSDRFVICGSAGQLSYSNILTTNVDLFSGNALSSYARPGDFIIVTQQQSMGDRTAYATADTQSIGAKAIWGGINQAPAYKFCRASNGRYFGASYGTSSEIIYKSDNGWKWTYDVSGAFAFIDPLLKNTLLGFLYQSGSYYTCAKYNTSTESWDKLIWYPLVPRSWDVVGYTSDIIYGEGVVIWTTGYNKASPYIEEKGIPIPSYWLKPAGDNKRTLDLVVYPAVMGNADTSDKISVVFPNGSGRTGTMKVNVKVLERWL